MKFERCISVKAEDINRLVETQFGLEEGEIDVAELFWAGEYGNDCYKDLYICDVAVRDADMAYEEEDTEENVQRRLIISCLHDIFPDEERLLVDVGW